MSVPSDVPHLSVGEYTTPRLSFSEDLTAYCEAGIEGIGIDVGLKLGGRGMISKDELAAFRDSGLVATFCFPGVTTVLPPRAMRSGPSDPADRVAAICSALPGVAVFEPQSFVCSPGPIGGYEPDRARELAVEGLRTVARACGEVGATMAIEPMHSSIGDLFSFITDLPSAAELLDDIGEPNTGVLVDVWHLWDTPDLLVHIRRLCNYIVGVHVDDWRDPTRSWADRVLPGDGIASVESILGALDDSGYRGWYELEIFSDDGMFGNAYDDSLWKHDPVELLREGRSRFEKAWRARRNDG